MSKPVSKGAVSVDPAKMSDNDLMEGAYMLEAAATLLRQSFGILSLTNSLQEESMSESELKSFAKQFDIVHTTCRVFAKGLYKYVSNRKSNGDKVS